jgi:hypothetical protein
MGWTVGRLVELSIVPDGTNQIWMDNLNCPTWPSNISLWQNNDASSTAETHIEHVNITIMEVGNGALTTAIIHKISELDATQRQNHQSLEHNPESA